MDDLITLTKETIDAIFKGYQRHGTEAAMEALLEIHKYAEDMIVRLRDVEAAQDGPGPVED